MNISLLIKHASNILPTTWPLKSMIAVNPLWDLHAMPFKDAINYIGKYIPIHGCLSYDEYISLFNTGDITRENIQQSLQQDLNKYYQKKVTLHLEKTSQLVDEILTNQFKSQVYMFEKKLGDCERLSPSHPILEVLPICREQVLQFMMSYFDRNQYDWYKNTSNTELFEAWKSYAILNRAVEEKLKLLPNNINDALIAMLERLHVQQNDIIDFFSTILSQLVGWHSYIKWIESRPNNPLVDQSATIAETLLIWCCCIDIELDKKNKVNISKYQPKQGIAIKSLSLLDIVEDRTLKEHLVEYLKSTSIKDLHYIWQRALEINYHEKLITKIKSRSKSISALKSKKAQFIFCIDTRSEGIRRHIEQLGNYETFGYAGFFSSLFCLEDNSKSECTLQAPALVEPNISLKLNYEKPSFLQQFLFSVKTVNNKLKNNLFTPFVSFEMFGNLATIPLVGKTSYSKYFQAFSTSPPKYSDKKPVIINQFLEDNSIAETAQNAYQFLKTIGLVNNMAPYIFICGHEAQTENNPFQASFECGACGGNSGWINAKITCEILNHDKIRKMLRGRGIDFGMDTRFIPACHNTTTDEFMVDETQISFIDCWKNIFKDINFALEKLKEERNQILPKLTTDDRHLCWAELIPEWGLANNAAMIVGPRKYTANINLERRVFLHSYEPDLDPDGAILGSILSAPVVVAHWINAQYYFSSTDPEIYGSGNKAIHNVIGDCGVIEGNLSDLKIGLPIQSVYYQNKRIHHPLRLLVIIFANPDLVANVLEKNPDIKSLFINDWASLKVISQGNIHEF
ncbi:MAG: DUF2309 family protein [Gammaproteobacteria bacterium]|jgi:uncharacterized protein YbcC (UPF0753/DUF2309 family)|nr:DUF2309 family protein [Gammaproteobacteria bacterium]